MSLRDHRILWIIILVCFICTLRTDRTNRDLLFLQNQIFGRALKPPQEQTLFEQAATGMVASADDPYAAYIPESNKQAFNEMIESVLLGIGVELAIDPTTQQPIITSPMYGSPAQRSGILAGDRIVRIENQQTTGWTMKEVTKQIQGAAGTSVHLAIARGENSEQIYTIPRESFPVSTVLGDRRESDGRWNFRLHENPQIGYIRITSFGQQTAAELESAIYTLIPPEGRGISGLILDLRDNPGGRLDQGIKTCDLFVDEGEIVTLRGRNQEIYDVATAIPQNTIHTDPEFPIVVLINSDTASAAEIVAACLVDHQRATIVGQRSFGKGSVQDVIDLPPGRGILKLTTGSYWRPSGRNIHRFPNAKKSDDWGVSPSPEHVVNMDDETYVKQYIWRLLFDSPRPELVPIPFDSINEDNEKTGKNTESSDTSENTSDAESNTAESSSATGGTNRVRQNLEKLGQPSGNGESSASSVPQSDIRSDAQPESVPSASASATESKNSDSETSTLGVEGKNPENSSTTPPQTSETASESSEDVRDGHSDPEELRKTVKRVREFPREWWLSANRMELDPQLQHALEILTTPQPQ